MRSTPLPIHAPSNALRLLLVEDEPPMLKLLTHFLSYLGYQVTAVSDQGEASRLLETERFDLLLTDLGFGEDESTRSLALLRRAREIQPGIQMLVLSGLADAAVEVESRRCGADEHLVKPVPLARIATALARMLHDGAAVRKAAIA